MREAFAERNGERSNLQPDTAKWFCRNGGATVLAVAVLSACIAGIVGYFQWDWIKDPDESVVVTLRNLGLLAAALPTITLAIWRTSVADDQAASARIQADIAHSRLLDERYQQAVSLLGSKLPATRAGSVFALARLAHEYPDQYLSQTVKLLCAFAQSPPAYSGGEDDQDTERSTPEPYRHDVAAAVRKATELARKLPELNRNSSSVDNPPCRLKLDRAKMARLELDEINLSNADLSSADLENANLRDANLNGTTLTEGKLKNAILDWADLRGADLTDADLDGAYLTRADLDGANLTRATLVKANLRNANLKQADLRQADLKQANLEGADLERANLSCQVELSEEALSEEDIPFADGTGAKLFKAILRNACLDGANLRGADLTNADLDGAKLRGADLTDASLRGAYLRRADLTAATLVEANLRASKLRESDLSGANLQGASLDEADLTGADLTGASVDGAVGLTNS